MPAQVVPATLHQGVGRWPTKDRGDGLGQPRHVTINDLSLQGQRRGGHHGRAAGVEGMGHGRDEISQRLARARTGLDQEMLAFDDGVGHGAHHLNLTRTLDPADPLDRGVQEGVEVTGFRRHCLRLCRAGADARPSSAGA